MIRQNRKIQFIILLVLVCLVAVMSIAYAILSTTLNITGNTEVVASNWNVHFSNISINPNSVTATKNPTIIDSKTVDFSVVLNKPGDYYEFTVDVVNDGTIDAMIDGITNTPTLTATQAKYLNYIIEYENGESINTKQLVIANSFVRFKVKIEFRNDLVASDLPSVSETLNLSFVVNYVQSDGTGSGVFNDGVKVLNAYGDINCIGTVVSIGSEKFYTIGIEDNNLKLLSMYNLYVGGRYSSSLTMYGDEATGMQRSDMLGWISGRSFMDGVTFFSSDTQKGNDYGDYSGSIVEGYVNNYKDLLENKYLIDIVDARLITYEELVSDEIGCIDSNLTCINAPSFIYSTTYWTGSIYSSAFIWRVDSDGDFRSNYYSHHANGVRPVIIIDKNLL